MTYIAKPRLHHPTLETNKVGYTRRDYEGKHFHAVRRLRARLHLGGHHPGLLGAGHRAPPRGQALGHWLQLQDARLFSGCLARLQHRARPHAQVLTGANLANRDLLYLGVSGDGDSASIGLGQFAHAMRRGVRMAYIVENNGVYGLTKGQFSATADRAPRARRAWSTATARSIWSAWPCSWAPPMWRAAFRATRPSWCR
jgi:2-oxoglutarate ferredoxin oxidoreductase subunit beta